MDESRDLSPLGLADPLCGDVHRLVAVIAATLAMADALGCESAAALLTKAREIVEDVAIGENGGVHH